MNHRGPFFETRCSLLTQATVGEVACVFLRYCSVCWNDYKNNSYWGDFLEYISGVTAAHFHKWQIAGLKWHIEYNGQREGKKWTVSFVELCRNTLRTTTAIALQLLCHIQRWARPARCKWLQFYLSDLKTYPLSNRGSSTIQATRENNSCSIKIKCIILKCKY